MGFNPSHFSGQRDFPVEMVNWFDTQDFCVKLTDLTQKPIRLPTEAEWRYACRAGDMDFHSGNGPGALQQIGWYNGADYCYRTQKVGRLLPNPFGLYDMHGNVLEWCADWAALGKYCIRGQKTLQQQQQQQQQQPLKSSIGNVLSGRETERVVCGGAWNYVPDGCTAQYRNSDVPVSRCNNCGFRVCFTPGA